MEYGFKISTRARNDLKSVWFYIARDNPPAATKFREGLLAYAAALTIFPFRGIRVLDQGDTRRAVYESYLIFYEIDSVKREIKILRFWHGAREQANLRLKEESSVYSPAPALAIV